MIALVGVIIFQALCSSAHALHPASGTDLKYMDPLIKAANQIDVGIAADYVALEQEKIAIHLARKAQNQNGVAFHQAALDRLRSSIKKDETDRDKNYHQAMQRALVAYGIVPADAAGNPIMPRKVSAHPDMKGRVVEWVPIYWSNQPRVAKKEAGPDSTEEIPPYNKAVGGLTALDGVTTMFGRYKSPADLGVLLYHELIHFEQFSDPKKAALGYNDREVDAYTTELPHLKEMGLGADHQIFVSFVSAKISEFSIAAKSEHSVLGQIRKLAGGWSPGDSPMSTPRTDEELEKIKKKSRDLNTLIREEAKQRAVLTTRQTHLASLRALARRLCNEPDSVTQAEFDALEYVSEPGFYSKELADANAGGYFGTCEGGRYADILLDLRNGRKPWLQKYVPAVAYYVPPPAIAVPQTPQPSAPLPSGPQRVGPIFDINLAGLAEKACSGSGVMAEDLKSLRWWFPMPELDIDADRERRNKLSGCVLSVYEYLLKLNKEGGKLDLAAINDQSGRWSGGGNDSRPLPDSRRHPWSKEPFSK